MTNTVHTAMADKLIGGIMNILRKRSDLPFSRKSDHKKEKSTVSFMHVQNIICSQTPLDGIVHGRPLFVGSYL